MIFVQFLLLALGFAMLIKGADWFVSGAAGIATRFGIPQIVIGLTIVAMGTSAPEAAVSISSSVGGSADITIGNIVGSNILNILIILGITATMVPIAVARGTIKVEIPFMIAITVVLLLLGLDGNITFVDALILLGLFAVYMIYLFRQAKRGKSVKEDLPEEHHRKPKGILGLIILTVIGVVVIIFGSQITVNSATEIARFFGASERFIGLTVVALGTSLPELFTSVTAAKKGNADIAIGNIVGSNIFNILFIVGISGLITTIPFASSFIIDTIISIGASVLLLVFCLINKALRRYAGIIFLIGYTAYFIYLLN